MVELHLTGDALWKRIDRAVQKVKERLERVAKALDAANIPYAVVGGNAVQIWVAQVDEAAVRNTRDVDIILDRDRLDDAIAALEPAGFAYRHVKSVDMFLDLREEPPKARDAVHVVFAGEKVRPDYAEPVPTLEGAQRPQGFATLALEDLVRMKLTSFRRKDQVHLLDMIELEIINEDWPARFKPEIAERLQELLDDPDG